MEKRRIEFTEPYQVAGEQFEEGDRKSFPKAQADRYIEMGIAKDPETGEQGERKPGPHRIQPDNVVQDNQ